MTLQQIIKEKLENFPSFRERRFRAKYLMKLALREMECEKKYYSGIQLSEEQMIEFATKYDSHRHEWDTVMRNNVHLQGQDYKDKDEYEQKKMVEFGYEGGFNQKLKI